MLKKKGQSTLSVWFLVLASLFFYVCAFPEGIIAFALSLVVNYLLALLILKNRKKIYLIVGVIFNIMLLGIYKYAFMILPVLKDKLSAPGISFYTFCAIALLVECQKGSLGELSLREYSLLMTFFPKIAEGPITLSDDMLSQKEGRSSLDVETVYRSILLFTLGCFKKVIIADTLGSAVDYGFADLFSMHTGEALVIMLSYTLQLYFDFSGYCDMAMAVASLFGFDLPLNFDSPYKARNIVDFWKRWHITLTKFLTRYLYIPLGGNRKGRARKYLNILIVFFVSGIWHGAGLTFIIWGMMHGVLYVIYGWIKDRKMERAGDIVKKNGFFEKLKSAACVFLTFIYVNVAWVFFRAPDMKAAKDFFADIGELWFPRFNYGLAKCFNIEEFWYVIKLLHLDGWNNSIYILMFVILALLLLLVFKSPSALEFSSKCRISFFTTALMTILIVWCMLSFEGVATYLYVNF
ncbi:MAG: MBOAT family protein [Lachnospiraceae bacterium]|nr:MBOAT family protein [Lachnospiraceae bacterium]